MELLEQDVRDEIAFSGTPDVISRYFTQFFFMNVDGIEGHDQYIYQHSNHNCVVGMADTHPIVREGKTVTQINFKPAKLDHLSMQVKGKTKKGGHWMQEAMKLCDVTCADGSMYSFFACVKGHLIEVNKRLADDPTLLQRKARKEGYIAIIKPKWTEQKTACSHLSTYSAFMQKRFGASALSATPSNAAQDAPPQKLPT